jgi:hypothetical protein
MTRFVAMVTRADRKPFDRAFKTIAPGRSLDCTIAIASPLKSFRRGA